MDATTKKFHDWIFEALDRSPDLSQVGLAGALGIAHPQITKLKKGERGLDVREVPIIAKYLGSDPPAWNTAGIKIKDEAGILALLGRIDGLSDKDIDIAFGVIRNALAAKRAGPAPLESRDQPQDASPRHEPMPSRKKARQPAF